MAEMTKTRSSAALLALVCSLVGPHASAATVTIRAVGSQHVGRDNTHRIPILPLSSPIELEVVLDTNGRSFEGYNYRLDFLGGEVSNIVLDRPELSPLVLDRIGPPIIFEPGGFIVDVNALTGDSQRRGLPPGVYVLETISFDLSIASIGAGPLRVEAGLDGSPGWALGGDVEVPEFYSTTILLVPEPSTALLIAVGLVAISIRTRSRRQ